MAMDWFFATGTPFKCSMCGLGKKCTVQEGSVTLVTYLILAFDPISTDLFT